MDRGATIFPQFMEQFCSLIKTRLRMLKNIFVRKLISCFPYIMEEFVTWFKSSLLLDRCEIY